MITGIPTEVELNQAGLDYLNLAWNDVMHLLGAEEDYARLQSDVDYTDSDLVRAHWQRESRRLATCAALVHQGAEFLLKSRIAQVSPFLLLDGPSSWPGNAAQGDTDFSSFKTLDAQLLTRVHDTICPNRLPETFKQRFEEVRRRRNAVTHGLASSLIPPAEELLKDILEIVTTLVGEATWPKIRREYENSAPAPWSDYHGAIPCSLTAEWDQIIQLLKPAECRRYLGLDKKQLRFACPSCSHHDLSPHPPIKIAVLMPNTPESRNLYCLACDGMSEIIREQCARCSGTVLNEDYECLACGWQKPNADEDESRADTKGQSP
ncbi:MAG TPA: hypothetical protein VE093_45580 [Polyangiaceae bacterium]|nr:hypothetical protein [Polyangiaceae bacterium]